MTITELGPRRPPRTPRRLVTVGQLSIDTILALDIPLAVGAQSVATRNTSIGGTAAIVAYNAAVLGGKPVFAGHVGASPPDRDATTGLLRAGVRLGTTVSTPVGLRVFVVINPDGERTMVATGHRPDWSRLQMRFSRGDIAFFEGWHLFDPASQPAYCSLIAAAATAGATVALDVCCASRASAQHAQLLAALPLDVVLANENEAVAFGLLTESSRRLVVVHRGSSPSLTLKDGCVRQHPVRRSVPLDTTGAGDTFAAGFLLGLSRGADLESAVGLGHDAARAVIKVVGPLLKPTTNAKHSLAI